MLGSCCWELPQKFSPPKISTAFGSSDDHRGADGVPHSPTHKTWETKVNKAMQQPYDAQQPVLLPKPSSPQVYPDQQFAPPQPMAPQQYGQPMAPQQYLPSSPQGYPEQQQFAPQPAYNGQQQPQQQQPMMVPQQYGQQQPMMAPQQYGQQSPQMAPPQQYAPQPVVQQQYAQPGSPYGSSHALMPPGQPLVQQIDPATSAALMMQQQAMQAQQQQQQAMGAMTSMVMMQTMQQMQQQSGGGGGAPAGGRPQGPLQLDVTVEWEYVGSHTPAEDREFPEDKYRILVNAASTAEVIAQEALGRSNLGEFGIVDHSIKTEEGYQISPNDPVALVSALLPLPSTINLPLFLSYTHTHTQQTQTFNVCSSSRLPKRVRRW